MNDPVFLSEPFIRTSNFVLSLPSSANTWGNCGPAQIVDELPGRAKGSVPHYLPEQTAHIEEFLASAGVPAAGARGGADTTYPEFALKLPQPTGAGSKQRERVVLQVPRDPSPKRVVPNPATGDIRVLPVQGNLYMVAGAGGNIAVQVGEDGVLLVDTGAGQLTDKVLAAPPAVRQADSLHYQYACASRSRGWQRAACQGRQARRGRPRG